MEPTEISYGMLKTEEGQVNAVYACFGAAAQHAQHFEVALAEFLLVYNKIAKKCVTVQDIEVLDKKLAKQTMGMLLRELKKHVKIDRADVDQCLDQALEKRNFLMHEYFREREQGFSNQESRMQMLAELVQIGNLQEQAVIIVRAMHIATSRTLESIRHRKG